MTWGERHRPFGTADLLMCQEMILDHRALTTLVAGCPEEEMVQKLPQLKGLLSNSCGKNAVFGSWCLFLTHLFIAAAVTVLQMTLCWPPAKLWVPWLCPLMPSRSNTHRSHSLLCLHCRLFQFLLPLLLITKHVLLIPHLWKLPSSLQHFQTSCRLAKPSATWLAASLLRCFSSYVHLCTRAGTLWMA